MAITQGRGNKTKGGSRYKDYRKYKKHELGRLPAFTGLGKKRAQKVKSMGGVKRIRLLREEHVNLIDPKTKKSKKVKIKTITESPANRHFVRRNIMTKGAIIETEAGKAKITSRPGQDGTINAVLIS